MDLRKTNITGFLNANKMPLKKHENICVFYRKLPIYNPQFTSGTPYFRKQRSPKISCYNWTVNCENVVTNNHGNRYPVDVLKFCNANGKNKKKHPTEKPINLCEYLIKTYTNEGDLVLDGCMGGGTTGVACKNLNRKFIGIELDENYYKIAKQCIENSTMKD